MNSITQDMKYRQSLIKYALTHGVARASRKYNRARSYIYFWLKRYDGSIESLACKSRRPHYHPNQHTDDELKLIKDMRRRNPNLGMIELWCRLKKRGYTRRLESLFRVMRKLEMLPKPSPKQKYIPKPYEQMLYPGQRVQIDVKVVPRRCIANPELRLYQYTAIDEHSRLRYLGAYEEQSTFSSADFLIKCTNYFKRRGITIECVQTDNGFEFTNRFARPKQYNQRNINQNLQVNKISQSPPQTLFEATAQKLNIRHKLIKPYTPRHNGKVERSHREDNKRFYGVSKHSSNAIRNFYSLADFDRQLAAYRSRSNNHPMRPLGWLSPNEYVVQDD